MFNKWKQIAASMAEAYRAQNTKIKCYKAILAKSSILLCIRENL
jgi:hypothetical protein